MLHNSCTGLYFLYSLQIRREYNKKEQRRRLDLNDKFEELRNQLPVIRHLLKVPKAKILNDARIFVKELQDILETLTFKKRAEETKQNRLKKRINSLLQVK